MDQAKMPASKPMPSEPKKQNPWLIASIILAIIVVAVLAYNYQKTQPESPDTAGAILSADEASSELLTFLDEIYGSQIGPIVLKEIVEESGLYKATITVTDQGQQVDQVIFVTKDGKIFIPQIIKIDEMREQFKAFQQQQQALPPVNQITPPPPPPADEGEGEEEVTE